ncbi:MAG: hypothetical protein ACI85N_000362 [Gammaproteobacteria bacterium]|jgi:hypothetical protein
MLKNKTIKSLVLFLLLSQLVTVAHALEHGSAHDENEQCFICLHNADLHNALFNSSSFNEINTLAFERIHYQSQGISLTTFSLHKNRSPPVTL